MKKHIIFLFVVMMTLSIAIPVNAYGMDENISKIHNCNDRIPTDNMIKPMYPAHPCHSGISHAYCFYYSCITKSCGCVFDRYQCCCGEKIPYRYSDMYYCDVHSPFN